MTKCQECDEWFHHKCTGLGEEEAAGLDAWTCGYCSEEPDDDGNCQWTREIPEPKKGSATVPPVRNINMTPRVNGIDTELEPTLDSWAEIEAFCRKSAWKLNLEGGLAARAVDDRLADEFIGIGLIESDLVDNFD